MKWEETTKGKEWTKQYHKQYYERNKQKLLDMQKERLSNPVKKAEKNAKDRERHRLYKSKLYALLGGAKCVRCGYDEDERALQLDHIHGGGRKDREIFRSQAVKYWMHYKDKPDEFRAKFQVLCANCNFIKKYEDY